MIASLAAKGTGIDLVNPSVIADRMIAGIMARPFEPAFHLRAFIPRPPGGVTTLKSISPPNSMPHATRYRARIRNATLQAEPRRDR